MVFQKTLLKIIKKYSIATKNKEKNGPQHPVKSDIIINSTTNKYLIFDNFG